MNKNFSSKLSNNIFLLFTLLFLSNFLFAQFNIPKKPNFQTSVYDYAGLLSQSEKSLLERKLINYADTTTTQIVVITIESLKGESIGILSPKWAQEWGIGGTKNQDNGLLILLSKTEKKIWISPGYGLEDKLTAGINGEIVRNIIVPEFKAGSFYNGLDKGTTALIDLFSGKYKGKRIDNQSNSLGFVLLLFIIFIILILYLASKNNSGNGNHKNRGGGFDLSDVIILSSLGRGNGGGFGGGSNSGGGFGGFGGGFGGGGFSGGGAGGDW